MPGFLMFLGSGRSSEVSMKALSENGDIESSRLLVLTSTHLKR